MSYALGIVVMIVGLIVSVALHELGHLLPAKHFGARVSRYMVGFGPTLWSRTYRGTEYGIKAILLGGFVTILGMYRKASPGTVVYKDSTGKRYTQAEADALDAAEIEALKPTMAQDARLSALEELEQSRTPGVAFTELAWWRKAIVMFGGPVVNLVLSVICLGVAIGGIGYQQPTTTLARVAPCLTEATTCPEAELTGPAHAAGLRPGDRVIAWAGHPTRTWDDVREQIAASGETTSRVVIERDGTQLEVTVTPRLVDGAPVVGVTSELARHRGGVGEISSAVSQTFWGTAAVVVRLPQQVWGTVRDLVTGHERDRASVMSVVGVARVSGEITSAPGAAITLGDRAASLLSLMGSLNMALFVFNLIPLLPLDGGHIVGALYEGLRRGWARVRGVSDPGAVDTARMMPLVMVVWGLLIVMTLVLVAADIVNPVHLG
ncbi:site-2 protease family protein [Nanchangia anserum]|uniref:Site-2 protease family protein n=1 Tax=Nanchangia anserum TaxID=2692125 RepID=A0A8I0GA22_9ACTO|nr:M50 family metallopeptidase [Nanchangia anserum]MBD3688978.1 site-2 protease family protein [Nanchangia anserum]QOX81230.1 site-2 protease family protein [Nanchangia anserum]